MGSDRTLNKALNHALKLQAVKAAARMPARLPVREVTTAWQERSWYLLQLAGTDRRYAGNAGAPIILEETVHRGLPKKLSTVTSGTSKTRSWRQSWQTWRLHSQDKGHHCSTEEVEGSPSLMSPVYCCSPLMHMRALPFPVPFVSWLRGWGRLFAQTGWLWLWIPNREPLKFWPAGFLNFVCTGMESEG
jgi:hypothetical protein